MKSGGIGEKIHLYHINDLHSHFENWPKIRRYLNEKKAEHEAKAEDVLLFDIGDFLDRVHPLTEATDGRENVSMMNKVPFDAVTIGNNEGIGNSKRILNQLYDHAHFPIVLANLFDIEDGLLPDWAEPYLVLQTNNGIRVGVIGLTSPLYLSYIPNGWQPKESFEILPNILKELEGKTDINVLLSHMGIIEDEHMAEMYEDIDVIIGGHTHHVLPEGRTIDGTLLTGGGKWGQYIGHTTIGIHQNNIQFIATELVTCDSLPDQPQDELEINRLWQKGINLLRQEEVADIPFNMYTNWAEQTDLLKLGLDAITEYSQTDVGILNSGLFLDDLTRGIVTKETLHRILPHPMRLIRCRMDGRNFKKLIWGMEELRDSLRTKPVTGMGFRGKIFGEIGYKGITVQLETNKIYYLGNELKNDDCITFVTVDHYRYISSFPLIENKGENELLFPFFLRDVVSQYLEKHFPLAYR